MSASRVCSHKIRGGGFLGVGIAGCRGRCMRGSRKSSRARGVGGGGSKRETLSKKLYRILNMSPPPSPSSAYAAPNHILQHTHLTLVLNTTRTPHAHHTHITLVVRRSYVAKFTPYNSKDPEARSVVHFYCLVDPRVLEDGDMVTLHGSVPVMGEWAEGVVGIPMIREESDPFIWSAEVELPFNMTESHITGMFEWKFVIVSGNGADKCEEGGKKRREKKMLSNFFGTFNAAKGNRRFKGWNDRGNKKDVVQYTHWLFGKLVEGSITPKVFVEMFDEL